MSDTADHEVFNYKIISGTEDQTTQHMEHYVNIGLNQWNTPEMSDYIEERGCRTVSFNETKVRFGVLSY